MTNKKVVMCECSGNGSTLSGMSDLANEANLNVAVTQGACRHGLGQLANDDATDLVVGCMQEQSVFEAVSEERTFPIRFINLRDTQRAQAKSSQVQAAVLARASYEQNYAADGVPGIVFHSSGRLAIVCDEHTSPALIEQAAGGLQIDVFVQDAASISLSSGRKVNLLAAHVDRVSGYLGAFEISSRQSNPVDTELCTRCGACLDACPTQSISPVNFTIDLATCDSNKACVKACGSFHAISFAAMSESTVREYDMVIDMREQSAFADCQPPLGFWHTGASSEALSLALLEALQTVGEFEKPKFFQYKSNLCAHSRSNVTGCSACIDTCSTLAIHSKGKGVEVDPHLCLGCGACATVCPTGAIQYAFSPAQSVLRATKVSLQTFKKAGGNSARVLVHASSLSDDWMEKAFGRVQSEQALIPVPAHHAASLGPDFWLGALAYGASAVSVVLDPSEAEHYGESLKGQADWVNALLLALGKGSRVQVVSVEQAASLLDEKLPAADWEPATFDASVEKRTRLDFAISHLAKGWAAEKPIPLPATAPFGKVSVDAAKCTLCMSCTGACPSSALVDNPNEPQLRFVESNCVQCGLCVKTCPESALSLTPQLNLSPAAKQKQVLNESQPYHCTSCGTAFGTKHMIENMLSKLSGHSMFAANAKRLTMCSDCRVRDMFEDKNEMTIFEVKR